jgi:hypothetical protein
MNHEDLRELAGIYRGLQTTGVTGDDMRSLVAEYDSVVAELLLMKLNHSETPNSSPVPPSIEEIATSSGVESAPGEFSQLKVNCYCITPETLREWEQGLVDALNENARLRSLLAPFRPDTDAQTDASYPATVNDVLHLLSCYIMDFLNMDDVEVGDEYIAAWERQARPVIERLMGRE